MSNCGGWGKGDWGGGVCQTGPWGGVDKYPPTLIAMQPNCGDTDINPAAPITIKISDRGCSGLSLDCVRIYVNKTLAYSGSGLTIGVNQANGFQSICDEACSSFTVSTDATCGDSIWTIKLCCTNFGCGATVQLSATFCDLGGNEFKIGSGDSSASNCKFKTLACNFIKKVEIIDNKRFVLRFANPMHGNPIINPDLYKPSSYTSTILDMYKQPLISKGTSAIPVRMTKVNKLLESLPPMYNKAFDTVGEITGDSLSPYHLLAALGIEDEKIGGNF